MDHKIEFYIPRYRRKHDNDRFHQHYVDVRCYVAWYILMRLLMPIILNYSRNGVRLGITVDDTFIFLNLSSCKFLVLLLF